jgi:hypothetical protein
MADELISHLRLLVETHGQLAAVLGLTKPAIYRAEQAGRIRRDPDGSWSSPRRRRGLARQHELAPATREAADVARP